MVDVELGYRPYEHLLGVLDLVAEPLGDFPCSADVAVLVEEYLREIVVAGDNDLHAPVVRIDQRVSDELEHKARAQVGAGAPWHVAGIKRDHQRDQPVRVFAVGDWEDVDPLELGGGRAAKAKVVNKIRVEQFHTLVYVLVPHDVDGRARIRQHKVGLKHPAERRRDVHATGPVVKEPVDLVALLSADRVR